MSGIEKIRGNERELPSKRRVGQQKAKVMEKKTKLIKIQRKGEGKKGDRAAG